MTAPTTGKDLVATINQQKEQLLRYKKRLQDVVVAYKKLSVEKEHLDETLKTLATVNIPPKEDTVLDSEKSVEAELNIKIVKLAQSLSTNVAEKQRLETQFQFERKQLQKRNAELEEKIKNISDDENKKSLFFLENHNRELELSNNIRELQTIIDEERKRREDKELLIEKLKIELKEKQEKLHDNEISSQNAKKSQENEVSSQKLMEKVQNELKFMKEQHDNAVQHEQLRTLKAEETIRRLAVEHEQRVSKLEEKLSQFSDLASRYDKHRQEDQEIIIKLKNRLIQLELENSNVKCEDDRVVANEETLIQQLQHIKHQLMVHFRNTNQLKRLKEILLEDLESACIDKEKRFKGLNTTQVKKETEYGTEKAKSNNNRGSSSEEIFISKQKVQKLRNKILDLESENSCLLKDIETERENMKMILLEENRKWEAKISTLEKEYRNRLIAMECELEKQRGRMSEILEEKEKHMQLVQKKYFTTNSLPESTSSTLIDVKTSQNDLLKRRNANLIYYLEDVARKEVEIGRLRKINSELQTRLHDLEQEYFHNVQLYGQIQEEIRRSEKQCTGTEELNNHYLKNVLLNYLLIKDSDKRSHMLNAIFAILKFSDLEINRVNKVQKQPS